MIEISVMFKDFSITYPHCDTGTVSYARTTAWLTKYPNAKTQEYTVRSEVRLIDQKTGLHTNTRAERTVQIIRITIPENAPKEVRELDWSLMWAE